MNDVFTRAILIVKLEHQDFTDFDRIWFYVADSLCLSQVVIEVGVSLLVEHPCLVIDRISPDVVEKSFLELGNEVRLKVKKYLFSAIKCNELKNFIKKYYL